MVLPWDQEKRTMALEAAAKGDLDAYAVSIPASLHSGSLRAKAFLAFIGWRATENP